MTAQHFSRYAISVVFALSVLGGVSSPATGEGLWFDIGADQETFVYEGPGGPSFEYFPAFPFGTKWLPGTLVYADLSRITCDALPGDCDPGIFVAGYLAHFDDGGCGCRGILYESCTLRLHYDGNVVATLGVGEANLVFARWVWDSTRPQWVAVGGVTMDTTADFAEADIAGSINGNQYYGIFTALPPPPPEPQIQSTTWGRIKALWN